MKILLDGVFFQLPQKSGITRVWQSLLNEWLKDGFAENILVLDRAGTWTKIEGIQSRIIPAYDYNTNERDRQMLEEICQEEKADLFISTYYTTPLSTPSVLMVHDMIPERMGANLNNPMWQQKHQAIRHASAYITVSQNTARDLVKFFPHISLDSVTIAPNGVNSIFSPASPQEIVEFTTRYGVRKPYFLMVGDRFGFNGYKNTILAFHTLSKLISKQGFALVCTGGASQLENELQTYTNDIDVHLLQLSDQELKAAYSGAIALIFPSKYEGFGLPIIEAMACGCPVITCPNSSIPEVAGSAALYINETDVNGLINALLDVQKPAIRSSLIRSGWGQYKKFSWKKTAEIISTCLSKTTKIKGKVEEPSADFFINESLEENSKIITQYKQNTSDNNALNQIRQLRKKITNKWLTITTIDELKNAYLSDWGKLHQDLLISGIKDEPLIEEEEKIVKQLSEYMAKGFNAPQAINHILVATLYCYAHNFPLSYRNIPIPNWWVNDYLMFMFSAPNLYQKMGESEKYYDYFQGWISYIHEKIFLNQAEQIWQKIGYFFSVTSNFIPVYFSTANVKEIYIKRSEIMEFSLKKQGYQLDYVLPPRESLSKIRLGILNDHFNPQTETFATLPVFEYLDRELFEIFLYAINVNQHSLEKYCESRADKLVKLPQDINEQVEILRADNLDILWIGTNITAVYKPITVLALHRLARLQMTSFCSPTTSGMRHIDYYIAGTFCTPLPNYQEQYREKLVTLEGCGFSFHYPPELATPRVNITRESLGISEDTIIFISGANFYKILPELRETWAKILATVPNSVLILYPFGPAWTRTYPAAPFLNNIEGIFRNYRVDIKRLKLVKQLPSRVDVKEVLKLGDIYLDSYPYSGATSLIDPLEVALPTVVMEGNALRFRQGAAMLRSLSMNDLITNNEESYIQLAVSLATNPQLRQQKREEIAQKMQNNPPFLDSRAYSLSLGNLFKDLFQQWQNSQGISEKTALSDSQFVLNINQVMGCVNLYQIDPSVESVVTELRQLRKKFADFWLMTPSEKLEKIYESEIGKAYQSLLNSGIQNEELTQEEQIFVQQLTQLTKGLIHPQAINGLLASMLYFKPGTMRIPNADNRLPHWLITDYTNIFETGIVTRNQDVTEETSTYLLQVQYITSPLFLNQLLGIINLYRIDSSDQGVVMELRQLRKQLADFWILTPPEKLQSLYQSDLNKAYYALLRSGIVKESMLDAEKTFFTSLITEVSKGMTESNSMNYLLAILLYCRPGQLKVQDANTSLPPWFLSDYETFVRGSL
ncbi:MAG: hypothetical protein RLZZ338_4610 [Cyanobacteriota bacterium]|jgi:predicted O-linked N-acetylglucosamine transferase (SPINDLY family)/glycosyltransferase involved in cell wall biosynthesis